ncbi:MAG: hypothetical protein AAF213_09895 [Pseudomonadota bacterium]
MVQHSRHDHHARQSGVAVRLIILGVAGLAGLVALGLWLFTSDPIGACVRNNSGDPAEPGLYAQALANCVQPAVASAETPGEASEAIYEFLQALEAVDAFAPLIISNWDNTPDALKGRAFTATMSRIVPYLRDDISVEVHGTGTDDMGDYVHVSYRSGAQGNRGTTLRLYLVDGPYGFRITRVQFAPV